MKKKIALVYFLEECHEDYEGVFSEDLKNRLNIDSVICFYGANKLINVQYPFIKIMDL